MDKSNVIPFPKRPAMIPGFDVCWVTIRSGDEASLQALQAQLDLGFEPFAVVGLQEMVKDVLSANGAKLILVEKMWLKKVAQSIPAGLDEPPPSAA